MSVAIDCPHCGTTLELAVAPIMPKVRARSNAVLTDEILDLIAADPGRWHLVRIYLGSSRHITVKTPPGVETMCKYPTRGGKRTELYARAIEPR